LADKEADHIQEEDQTKLHEDEAKRSEGLQTDHNQIFCSDEEENTFSNEELDSSSFIYNSIFNSIVQDKYIHNEFFNINDVENGLIIQHDDEIVGLNIHEDQQLMEGHIQSLFVDIEHSHFSMAKSFTYQFHDQVKALKYDELYVAKNPFHEEFQEECNHLNVIEISGMITIVNPHENQSVDIQPSLLDPHKKKSLKVNVLECAMSILFMMSIQKSDNNIFIFHHTRKFMTILLCLINMMKVFLKMMRNKKL
jgi:hypothetical protein